MKVAPDSHFLTFRLYVDFADSADAADFLTFLLRRNTPSHFSIIFNILKAPAFQKYSTWWVFSALYLAVPGITWLLVKY